MKNTPLIPQQRRRLILAASIAFLCVAMGAFGAHAFNEMLSDVGKQQYDLGLRYAFIHALGILLAGVAMPIAAKIKRLNFAVGFFSFGIVFFSGSLLVFAFTQIKFVAMLIPVGGLAFLIGWLFFILAMVGEDENR